MDARKKLSKQGKHFALTIPEGQLISVNNLPNKQAYNKGQSNFWFDEQKKILHFREGQKKDKSIQLTYQNQQYQYEGVISSNIYEVIVRTSIFSLLFGGTTPHVAVTEESLRLPFEQQPWFIGAVDKGELKAIELAETRMFFTRAKGPKIYLHWTTTSKMKTPRRAMLLESNDLSLVLPKDEFITARYNGGVILNHNEVLICRRVIENKLDEVKNIFEQGVNLASFVLREPNLISCYIESTTQESVNEELLLWLLEKGFPVDHDDTKFIDVATSKCSDIVVEVLLERGVKCSQQAVSRAIKRDIPPHRMKIYFKALANTKYCHFEYYFNIINDYRDTEYTNRVLVTLAWRHGNEDNLFKQLPKEIVQHIISYGVDDEYPWLEYIELFDLKQMNHISYHYRTLSHGELIKLAVIGWHYWQKLSEHDIEFIYQRLLFNKHYPRGSEFYDNLSPWQMNMLVSWLIKFSTRHTLKQTAFTGSSFILYLLNNQNSAPIVKTLIQARVTPREWWLELTNLGLWSYPKAAPIPLSWHAVNPTKPHKALIELLIHEGLMPEQCLWYHRNTGLIAYLKRHGTTEDIEALSQFIEECRNKSKTSPLIKN